MKLWNLVTGIPELSVSVVLVYLLCFLAYGVEKLRARDRLSERSTQLLHAAVQVRARKPRHSAALAAHAAHSIPASLC